ncbi:hypothetical protein ABZS66_39690 [Dactylosporangium sp. NPDC005572]|uniref:hypothetical protein n=1 Tax=Dactylosporangium sp. NPDC005572 TaxID=3156889 RepID=UPI0033AF5D83
MTDRTAHVARRAARILTPRFGELLPVEVEAVLDARRSRQPSLQFVDPIAVASLVVSTAALAWTMYTDLKNGGQRAQLEDLRAHVLDALEDDVDDAIIDAVTQTTVATPDEEEFD